MPTTRTPIGRPPVRRITAEAITIFRKMVELEERCTCPPTDDDRYFKGECCPACAEWWQENSALVDVLRLKPWEWPAFENPDPNIEGNYKPAADAVARYHALKAASEAAKKKFRR
jgi:hypothetical protein